MTANKYDVGDAVRFSKDIKQKMIIAVVQANGYILKSPNGRHYNLVVHPWDIEPWSDKLHCLYCGAEIVIKRMDNPGDDEFYIDISKHNDKCPLHYGAFSTEQEAIDAYSMKWEG